MGAVSIVVTSHLGHRDRARMRYTRISTEILSTAWEFDGMRFGLLDVCTSENTHSSLHHELLPLLLNVMNGTVSGTRSIREP